MKINLDNIIIKSILATAKWQGGKMVDYRIGEKIAIGNSYVKIMAYADGYYMSRRKGCIPFVANEKELEIKISAWKDEH